MKTPAKKPVKSVSAMEALIKLHDGIRRRGEYAILGQVESIDSEKGRVAFFGTGPVIARSTNTDDDGGLIVLTPFTGLPEEIELSDRHCTKCLAPCDVCSGKGKVTCSLAQGCRGSGKMKIPMGACSCTARPRGKGLALKSCKKCNGSGNMVELRVCEGCKGTKTETCNQCRGEGKYATGKKDASTDIRAKLCTDCNGTQREIVRSPQDPALLNTDGAFRVVRGIRRLVWKSMELEAKDGQPTSSPLQICEISPDSGGQLMSLFIDHASNMYCMHGVPRLM